MFRTCHFSYNASSRRVAARGEFGQVLAEARTRLRKTRVNFLQGRTCLLQATCVEVYRFIKQWLSIAMEH